MMAPREWFRNLHPLQKFAIVVPLVPLFVLSAPLILAGLIIGIIAAGIIDAIEGKSR